ncbi:hypothetical protein ACWGDX_36975 [Streptomyces sp. NPDC055025]
MPDFHGLKTLVSSTAKLVHEALGEIPVGSRPPVHRVRGYLRDRLLRAVDAYPPPFDGESPLPPPAVAGPLDHLAERLSSRQRLGLVLAALTFQLRYAAAELRR